jgi:hypothetical protein
MDFLIVQPYFCCSPKKIFCSQLQVGCCLTMAMFVLCIISDGAWELGDARPEGETPFWLITSKPLEESLAHESDHE